MSFKPVLRESRVYTIQKFSWMVEGGNSMETVSQCVLIDFSPFSVVDFGFGVFFDVFIFFPSIFKKKRIRERQKFLCNFYKDDQ